MISFVKGIFYDQANRISKMLLDLTSSSINKEIDKDFLDRTVEMLQELNADIQLLVNSGDLDIDALASYNIIKYNTFHERLLTIELFRYLVIINYGQPEEYFKKKVNRIYKEINCLQKQPIITTISNSENYYWALPTYDIIAVPTGEERNLLNLPDLYHEMGHLIYNQYDSYLVGGITNKINQFYQDEIQAVVNDQRDPKLITFYRDKNARWINGWIMEFTCDFIATYLVGPAYAWTNLKLTTLSSGKDRVFMDSQSHPSDEARMRGIFYMLRLMGHTKEVEQIETSWQEFLNATNNPIPVQYDRVFPTPIIEQLAKNAFDGCMSIDLRIYNDQVTKFTNPISKILNDAWLELFNNPDGFHAWEEVRIKEIAGLL
jgi:hypothetical protein